MNVQGSFSIFNQFEWPVVQQGTWRGWHWVLLDSPSGDTACYFAPFPLETGVAVKDNSELYVVKLHHTKGKSLDRLLNLKTRQINKKIEEKLKEGKC